MLEKIKERFRKEKSMEVKVKIPKHIAMTMDGMEEWKNKEETYKKSFQNVMDMIKQQIRLDVPIITFYVLNEKSKKEDNFFEEFADFIASLAEDQFIKENHIKFSVLGKWYNLTNKIVENIKKLLDATKDHEDFFVNLCINYDGQEEIVDACKLIARKIKSDKIEPDSITKETIKENIYSSYFIAPDLIIVNGHRKMKTSLLLWDSANSCVYFTNSAWPYFDKAELMDAINVYQKSG